MRLGVVGLGYWGSKHVRVLCGMPEVESVTGFDLLSDRAAHLEAIHTRFRVARSLGDLLREVDGVVVATSASTHFAIASAALREGVHVLVEKPFVMRYQDGLQLKQLASENGCVIVVGHTFLFDPAIQTVRDTVQSGRLGRVLRITSRRVNVLPGAADCDVIWDLAPHDFSICDFVLGAAPSSVRARGHRGLVSGAFDDVRIDLEYGTERIDGYVHVSWGGPARLRQLEVVGENARITYDDSLGDHRIALIPQRPSCDESPTGLHDELSSVEEVRLDQPETLLLVHRHFLECMHQRESWKSGVDLGLAVTAALEATSCAALTGETRPVQVVDGAMPLVLAERAAIST